MDVKYHIYKEISVKRHILKGFKNGKESEFKWRKSSVSIEDYQYIKI